MALLTLNKDYFEKVLFKSLIASPSRMGLLSQFVEPDYFDSRSMQICVDYYLTFFKKHERLPSISELKLYATPELLTALKSSWESEGVSEIKHDDIEDDVFFEHAEQYLKEKLAVKTMVEVAEDYGKKPFDAEDFVKKAESIAAIKIVQDEGFDIKRDLEGYLTRASDNTERISTGFAEIDDCLGGGALATGKFLGVITAPPNKGKSIMLGTLAVNAVKQGKSVLLITLEMSQDVYATRVYSALYDIPIGETFHRGEELKTLINEDGSGSMLIKEYAPSTMTVSNIDGFIETLLKRGRKFDMIVVDYLTLLDVPGADNSNDAGKQITRKLRALTYKYKVPIWTACQINREGMNQNRPEMHHIAESIAICAEADVIGVLYTQDEDPENEVMRFGVLKNRLGLNELNFSLHFNHTSLKFEDMSEAMNTQSENATLHIDGDVIMRALPTEVPQGLSADELFQTI